MHRLLLALAAVFLVAGCASGMVETSLVPQSRPYPKAVPHGFLPSTGADFGTRDVWLLGEYRCAAGWCWALLRSTDGGRRYARVRFPKSLPAEGMTPTIAFADARDGYAYALDEKTHLFSTHDGGVTWSRLPETRVEAFATGGGYAYVSPRGAAAFTLGFSRTAVSRDSWDGVGSIRRMRLPLSFAARGTHFWMLLVPRQHRADDRDALARSSDRGRRFRTGVGPCETELGGRLEPAGHGVVWAVCPSGMMAALWLSTNGGRSFTVASFHDPGGTGLPALSNAAAVYPFSRRVAVLDGGGGPLLRTTDQGKRWKHVRQPGQIVRLDWLGVTSRESGLALVQTTGKEHVRAELWRTTDAGASWQRIPTP